MGSTVLSLLTVTDPPLADSVAGLLQTRFRICGALYYFLKVIHTHSRPSLFVPVESPSSSPAIYIKKIRQDRFWVGGAFSRSDKKFNRSKLMMDQKNGHLFRNR